MIHDEPRVLGIPALVLLFAACSGGASEDVSRTASPSTSSMRCDVVVAGGTTAALAAALTSAREGVSTCLLEPTDWPGGQLTAGGVPAIDYAWSGPYASAAKSTKNLPADLTKWMAIVGDPGACSVSNNCFLPKDLLSQHGGILETIGAASSLTVLKNTVVKSVVTTASSGGRRTITQVNAIRRTPTATTAWGGYDRTVSQDIADWYAPNDSARYTKERIAITRRDGGAPVVIDATELGDVLVLSGAPYMQGVEIAEGSTKAYDDRCGQAISEPFVMRYEASPVSDSDVPTYAPEVPNSYYGYEGHNWQYVWRYRRLKAAGQGDGPFAGDLSSMNWRLGNDYAFGYFLASKSDAAAEVSDWRGGVDTGVLERAEHNAFNYFHWYRGDDPRGQNVALDRGAFGTGHGLAKFFYVRDTRRSVGVGGFVLTMRDLVDDGSGVTARRFVDRVGIGLYGADLHPIAKESLCKGGNYPSQVYDVPETLPFFLPLRALTNRDVANLLVAGKTMAQSFVANEATRLHPIEYASGVGAGAAAATMARGGFDNAAVVSAYATVQSVAAKYTPIDWSIGGRTYPAAGESLTPLASAQHLFCPPATWPDLSVGYCVDDDNAYGPFSATMTRACHANGGGSGSQDACVATRRFVIDGHPVDVVRWSRQFAADLRGWGACMSGTHRDAAHPEVCVEESATSASGAREAYGPFDANIVAKCLADNPADDACYSNRWGYAFYDWLSAR